MLRELLRRKRVLTGLVVALVVGVIACLGFAFDFLHTAQQRSTDFLFQAANLYQSAEAEDTVVIVGIDEESLEELGHLLSWPRSYHAQLIDILADAEARAIVFDILFAEPAPGDDLLAAAISGADNVILPVIYRPDEGNFSGTPPLAPSNDVIRPLEMFAGAASGLGHAGVTPDADGVVRRLALVVPGEESHEPALSLAAAAGYLRRPQEIEAPLDGKMPFAGRMIPVNARGEMLFNYLASPQGVGGIVSFPTVSFCDVLNQEVDPALFRDKVVLIGATASGMGDTFLTPMGVMKSGVELHAIALHTILEANFLQPVPPAITLLLIIFLALVCGVAVLYFRVLMAALVTVLLVAAYFLSAFFLFDQGMVLNMTYPPLAIAVAFVGVNLYQVISERSEKRVITETFGRYLSPQVVEKILDSLRSGDLELGGSEHDVTVAFADVRGFTSISEKTPPAALVTALNTYLSAVIDAVIEQGGMVNKFGGDSVMAVWNAPVASPEHALLAIKAAMNAQNAVSALRMDDRSLAGMEFGIGINSGRALAGNMGSQDRLEYSVVGDTVNVAARLADAAPGGRVWIGADTFAMVEEHIVATPLPPLTLRGKSQPVQAYEVVEVKSG